jgi:poly(3-hydroxybutyrate) depolymerase
MVCLMLLASVALAAAHTPAHHPGSPSTVQGCGQPHEPGYNTKGLHGNYSVISNGITRYYTVQVPKGYNAHHQYPLIFDYHGNGGTSGSQRNNSAYFNYTQDYLVVYPQGLNRSWEGPSYAVDGVNDTLFTTDLLSHIKTEYCIDPDRVYASGKSNGGGFVDLLACSNAGDAFAAFAMASAALYTDTSLHSCNKKRAILESHGDLDTTIPYTPTKPGRGGDLPNITDWVHWWGVRDCGPRARPQYDTRPVGYDITSYSCGRWHDVVQHYQVFELGHCWPSSTGTNQDALTLTDQHCAEDRVLAFTPVVLNFFSKWDLRKAKALSSGRTTRHRW